MERIKIISDEQQESRLVWQFFDQQRGGVFVEVGANHPTRLNQTWFLEQQGWSGILIEPNPRLCELLRAQRPQSKTFQAAVGNPTQTGEVELLLGKDDLHSTLAPKLNSPLSGEKVRVPLRTLDSILIEADVKQIDFLSIDVEGLELEVLKGLSLKRHTPKLILLEEHRRNFKKHFYLRRQGYRLVKRTGLNNWYVPDASPATVHALNSPGEIWHMWRKMWLNAPLDIGWRRVRNWLRGRPASR